MMAVRLRNGLSIPCVGSNGVMIDMEMIRSVHSRLVALQKEEGSLEALNLLYGMCRQLVVQKGINEDAVLIQDGTAKELLKKHRIIVGQEIEPKLSIVYNCWLYYVFK